MKSWAKTSARWLTLSTAISRLQADQRSPVRRLHPKRSRKIRLALFPFPKLGHPSFQLRTLTGNLGQYRKVQARMNSRRCARPSEPRLPIEQPTRAESEGNEEHDQHGHCFHCHRSCTLL